MTTAPKTADRARPASPTAAHKLVMANVVTLEQLAIEMKVSPRDARMLLRLASKQISIYPNLSNDHVPRQPWQWAAGSKALYEARKALTQPD